MSDDKTYECTDCGHALTDANRLVCEGDDCMASLCVDCAIAIGNLNTGVASVYCLTCATEKVSLLDSSAGDRVECSSAIKDKLFWTTIKERGLA